jgi:hypothetical protein
MTSPKVGERRYFRFDRSVHANALVNEGKIRITTVERCRKKEEIGIGRCDTGENTLYPTLRMALTRMVAKDDPGLADLIKQGYLPHPLQMPEGTILVVKPRPVIEYDIRPDLFMYCVSRFQTRRAEIRFASPERDDSWVEIFDESGFFGALDKKMTGLGHSYKGLKTVLYRSRRFPSSEGLPKDAELIKEGQFHCEHEARACWTPATPKIDKLDLVIPELTKCCRIQRKVLPTCFPVFTLPVKNL